MANNGPQVNNNAVAQSSCTEVVDNFDDMNLRESLLRGIVAYGLKKPSDLQQRAIMPAIKGKVI